MRPGQSRLYRLINREEPQRRPPLRRTLPLAAAPKRKLMRRQFHAAHAERNQKRQVRPRPGRAKGILLHLVLRRSFNRRTHPGGNERQKLSSSVFSLTTESDSARVVPVRTGSGSDLVSTGKHTTRSLPLAVLTETEANLLIDRTWLASRGKQLAGQKTG